MGDVAPPSVATYTEFRKWQVRTAQRAAPSTAGIPVIVLSAAHDVTARAAGLDAAAVVSKPFDLGPLLNAIASVVDGIPPNQPSLPAGEGAVSPGSRFAPWSERSEAVGQEPSGRRRQAGRPA